MRIADRISVPTSSSRLKTMTRSCRPARSAAPSSRANAHIDVHVTGVWRHCGFIAAGTPDDDGYWAETQIVNFVNRIAPQNATAPHRARSSNSHTENQTGVTHATLT